METITWKWNHFWKRTIPGFFLAPIVGLLVGLLVGQIYELSWPSGGVVGLTIGGGSGLMVLFFGLILGLARGLIGGFTDRVMVDKASPNQGIKLSRQNCFAAFLVTCLAVGLFVGLLVGLFFGVPGGPSRGLSYGLSFGSFAGSFAGLIVGLNRGGSAVIKHYALRLTLWRSGYTPFKFVKFLDQCNRLILLKKVGGGYIFIHRMLLEYFAELDTSQNSVPEWLKAKR